MANFVWLKIKPYKIVGTNKTGDFHACLIRDNEVVQMHLYCNKKPPIELMFFEQSNGLWYKCIRSYLSMSDCQKQIGRFERKV